MQNLPPPCAHLQQQSQRLVQMMHEMIVQCGPIPFSKYMDLALYHPQYGYYTSSLQKLGKGGDYTTAPEISPLFSQCVAKQCQQILTLLPDGCIIELGAGTGRMAADILLSLERWQCLPKQYFILELSGDLQSRQRAHFEETCAHLLPRVTWLTCLPASPVRGIVLANEVMDALAVERFCLNSGKITQSYVATSEEGSLVETFGPPTPALQRLVSQLPIDPLQDHYVSELHLSLPAWLGTLADSVQQGLLLLMDYGFPRSEYYHWQRHMGTLMCHTQHYAHSDPFFYPGCQDITAHVDFTAVAEAALASGCEVAGYCQQAAFLLSCGLLEMAQQRSATFADKQAIQLLTAEHEMGELCKVIALTKGIHDDLLGFQWRDARGRL